MYPTIWAWTASSPTSCALELFGKYIWLTFDPPVWSEGNHNVKVSSGFCYRVLRRAWFHCGCSRLNRSSEIPPRIWPLEGLSRTSFYRRKIWTCDLGDQSFEDLHNFVAGCLKDWDSTTVDQDMFTEDMSRIWSSLPQASCLVVRDPRRQRFHYVVALWQLLILAGDKFGINLYWFSKLFKLTRCMI